MKKQIFTVAAVLLTSSAWAGGGHFHPKQIIKCAKECTTDQIKGAIPESIAYLNKWGKIEASWATAKVVSVETKQFKKGPEWIVTLADASSAKRYVFFTMDGFVTGANATGE